MTFTIRRPEHIDRIIASAREAVAKGLQSGKPVVLKVTRQTRSTEQNSRLWALLRDISEQVVWHGQQYDDETWKVLLIRAWGREPKLVPAIGGGVEMIDDRSSKLTVAEMAEFQTYIEAFGAEHGVRWRAPKRWDEMAA